jgi:hypothetical protein
LGFGNVVAARLQAEKEAIKVSDEEGDIKGGGADGRHASP